MYEPRTEDEYNRRFRANTEYFGIGIETGMTVPCPFCAAANFVSYKIIEVELTLSEEHICRECKRGSKSIFSTIDGSKSFEMVQTCGPDPAGWMPKMRRV